MFGRGSQGPDHSRAPHALRSVGAEVLSQRTRPPRSPGPFLLEARLLVRKIYDGRLNCDRVPSSIVACEKSLDCQFPFIPGRCQLRFSSMCQWRACSLELHGEPGERPTCPSASCGLLYSPQNLLRCRGARQWRPLILSIRCNRLWDYVACIQFHASESLSSASSFPLLELYFASRRPCERFLDVDSASPQQVGKQLEAFGMFSPKQSTSDDIRTQGIQDYPPCECPSPNLASAPRPPLIVDHQTGEC